MLVSTYSSPPRLAAGGNCRLMLTSQCNTDRTLQHIAKKGRPVSQCTHCRTLRKSRSAHVKCDCGEKSHTKGSCTHVKETDPKGKLRLPCRLTSYSDTRHSRYLLLHSWWSLWLRSQEGAFGPRSRIRL